MTGQEVLSMSPCGRRWLGAYRAVATAVVLALVATGVAVIGGRPTPAAASSCAQFWPMGKIFYPDESYSGCNGEVLIYQSDGNVVLYGPDGTPRWATGAFAPSGMLLLQSDGNLVQYDSPSGERAVWASNTFTSSGYLGFGHDGNLVVFRNTGADRPLWWSNRDDCEDYKWSPGKVFRPGAYYVSCTGEMLIMQSWDGNVVQYDKQGQVAWATNVAAPNGRMEFQAYDGNVVVYDSSGVPVWATNAAAPNGSLQLSPNGVLAVFTDTNDTAWVQADPEKQKVREKLEQARERLRQMFLNGEIGAEGQPAYDELGRAIRELDNVQLNAPCTTWGEFGKALAGAVAALAALIKKIPDSLKALLATFGITEGGNALYNIIVKCWEKIGWNGVPNPQDIDWRFYQYGMTDVPGQPIRGDDPFGNWGFAFGPNGTVSAVMGDAFVVGHPEWRVDFGTDPQTPANTVVQCARDHPQRRCRHPLHHGQRRHHVHGRRDAGHERDHATRQLQRTVDPDDLRPERQLRDHYRQRTRSGQRQRRLGRQQPV